MDNQEIDFEQIQILKEELFDKITEVIRLVPEDYQAQFSEDIIFHTVNYGSRDYYQALGILEEAKNTYVSVSKQVQAEEAEECICDDCREKLRNGEDIVPFFQSSYKVDSKDIN